MSTEDEDALDAELRRLFDDERLTLRPREDATTTILTGARRLRRRRAAYTATGGALAALVLVSGGVAVNWVRSPQTETAAHAASPSLSLSTDASSSPAVSPPAPVPGLPPAVSAPAKGQMSASDSTEPTIASSTTSAPASASAQRLPLLAGPVLGPNGYEKLTLGMSYDIAKKTGMLAVSDSDPEPSGCGQYPLREGKGGVQSVTISPTKGIVRFDAGGAHTPERVRVGSSKDDLAAAYPDLTSQPDGYTAPTGSGATYLFTLDGRGQVASLALTASDDC